MSRVRRSLLLLLAAALPLRAVHAGDAFRAGQPATLEPPPPGLRSSLQDAPTLALRDSLARRGMPRFALTWNVAFSDEVVDARRRVRQSDVQAQGEHFESEESAVDETSTRFLEGGYRDQRRRVDSDETRRIGHDGRDDATRAADWAMQPAFAAELSRAGVRFVDKRVATRLGALDQHTADYQSAEMAGLERYADYLIEVTVQRTPGAPLGRAFRVSVIGTRDGEQLVDFLSDATVRFEGHRPYVAGPTGFQRAAPPRASPEQAVRQLAIETAQHLLAALP